MLFSYFLLFCAYSEGNRKYCYSGCEFTNFEALEIDKAAVCTIHIVGYGNSPASKDACQLSRTEFRLVG